MKWKFFIPVLILSITFISCKIIDNRQSVNKNSDQSVFSPALEREIVKMIDIKNFSKDKGSLEPMVCSVAIVRGNENSGDCNAIVTLGPRFLKTITKFIPPSDSPETQTDSDKHIIGYTYLNDEVVGCYILSTSCNKKLIDEGKLRPITDSILNYHNIFDSNYDFIINDTPVPMRIYRIINTDSLQLIKSTFIPIE